MIAEQISDWDGAASVLGNMANAWRDLGQPGRAFEYCELQLAVARRRGGGRSEAMGWWSKALALEALGRREQAIECAKEFLQIKRVLEDPSKAEVESWLRERGAEV